MNSMAQQVVIYTTPTCTWCQRAKEFFAEHDIAYTEYNVQEDREKAEEMIEKSEQRGVPVIDVDGEIVVGFNKKKLAELLQRDG